MRLARFASRGGEHLWGKLGKDGAIDAPRGSLQEAGLVAALERAPEDLLEALDRSGTIRHSVEDVQLLAPIGAPSKVIGVGRNYRAHVAETGSEEPSSPMLFGILPSALTGPTDDIELPLQSEAVDWEGELGVVIGRRARHVPRASALDVIAGYVVVNDITARDLQRSDGQWTRAKSFDTFKPTGPCVATADDLGLARSLRVEVHVNGEQRQSATTDQMIFPVDVLLEFITSFCTLMPGDIVATGTPSGVGAGMDPPVFLKAGDVVETSVEGIGRLVNKVTESGHSQKSAVGSSDV